ncbi:MAG: branched-chain amino acid aminotransferase [Anaerolineales bacterium]|nr:branched-chain amino acid aminotransferase [Anaerolineales bacterium]MCB8953483.1 branched-chain amino acid aminotransferase [Ardenticatenales bacterium]
MEIDIKTLEEADLKPVPTSNFGFCTKFSDRMFMQHYDAGIGWHDATICPYQSFSLEPSSAVLHYGQSIFEGFKAYRRPDGDINLFRPWENMRRFNQSAVRMAMPAVDEEEHLTAVVKLIELDHNWVPDTPGSSLYVRPVMIGTETALGVHASSRYLHYVILSPSGAYFKEGFNPIPVYISDKYRRAVVGGTGEAKTAGNYAASLYVSEEARKKGYSQVLWLDAIHGRYVEEVGAMNIAFVYEGKRIVTPALTGSILPGVTRDSVLTLAPTLGYETSEARIDVYEMLADIESGKITEVFGCGTAAVIAPVGKFGYLDKEYIINGHKPGPVTTHLYQALTDIQYGRSKDPFGWTMKIHANAH